MLSINVALKLLSVVSQGINFCEYIEVLAIMLALVMSYDPFSQRETHIYSFASWNKLHFKVKHFGKFEWIMSQFS